MVNDLKLSIWTCVSIKTSDTHTQRKGTPLSNKQTNHPSLSSCNGELELNIINFVLVGLDDHLGGRDLSRIVELAVQSLPNGIAVLLNGLHHDVVLSLFLEVENLDAVAGDQTGRLSHLLHAVDELARDAQRQDLFVLRGVDRHDERVVLRHASLELRTLAAELALHHQLLLAELEARHRQLVLLLELLHVLRRALRQRLRHRLEVLAQAAAQHAELGGDAALAPARLAGLVAHLQAVQLLHQVALQRLDVAENLGVGGGDDDAAHGALQRDRLALAQHAAHLDRHHQAAHLAANHGVVAAGEHVGLRQHDVVDGLGAAHGVDRHVGVVQILEMMRARRGADGVDAAEVLVEVLGEEGREGRHQAAESQQALVENRQRDEGLLRVSAHALAAAAVQPHIAVGEQVDEVHEARHHRVETVRLHLLADEADELLRGGLSVTPLRNADEQPAVHHVGAGERLFLRRMEGLAGLGLPVLDVLQQEAVGVVPRDEHVLQHAVHAGLLESERLRSHHRRVDEVQTHRVGAVFVDDGLGVGVVLQALAHLLAVLGEHQAVHDDVLPGGLVEQRGGQHHQRVEPASRLVEALRDEIGGEVLLYASDPRDERRPKTSLFSKG